MGSDPVRFDDEMWHLRKLVPMDEADDARVRVTAVKAAGAAGVEVRSVLAEVVEASRSRRLDVDGLLVEVDRAAAEVAVRAGTRRPGRRRRGDRRQERRGG